jgi:hypothetical protein
LVLGRAASIRTVVLGVAVDVCEVVLCCPGSTTALAVVVQAIAAACLDIEIAVFLAALIVVVVVHVLGIIALGDIAGAVAGD